MSSGDLKADLRLIDLLLKEAADDESHSKRDPDSLALRNKMQAGGVVQPSLRGELLPDWATQYYVAGRMAARARLTPIYGNLLHHAVEMFLKYALIDVVSPEQMRSREYGHNLEWLWQRYKDKEADPAFERFDRTVHALHEFEELRYPDKIPPSAILVAITWQSSDAVEMSGAAAAQKYEFPISDVDRLVIKIVKRIPLNPKFYMSAARVGQSEREALQYQNPHAADWLC